MALIGDLTVTAARARGEDLLAEIVEKTSLPLREVRKRLEAAHGNTQIRSIFVNEWPDRAGEISTETVAGAKANALRDRIASVTNLDEK